MNCNSKHDFPTPRNGYIVIKQQFLKVGLLSILNVITHLDKTYFYATLSIMVGQTNNNNMDEFVVIQEYVNFITIIITDKCGVLIYASTDTCYRRS